MDYLIAYLEGVLSFASPCLLPMLPIYLSYFSARQTRKAAMLRVAAFTAGIAAVFCSMGALAGLMGRLLIRYATALNLVCGALMVAAGQGLPGLSKLSFLQPRASVGMGMLSSFLLGAALSLVWTPCIGAFLGSALLLAATAGSTAKGIIMLLCYSLGLGSPIAICAALVSQLRQVLQFAQRRQRQIDLVCGLFLVAVGILTAAGMLQAVLGKLM